VRGEKGIKDMPKKKEGCIAGSTDKREGRAYLVFQPKKKKIREKGGSLRCGKLSPLVAGKRGKRKTAGPARKKKKGAKCPNREASEGEGKGDSLDLGREKEGKTSTTRNSSAGKRRR